MNQELNILWKQENNKVSFKYLGNEIYFIVPENFELKNTHKDILRLIEILLLSPWHKELLNYKFTRKKGKKIGLSMSTGVDSTAAMLLLPNDTICAYLYRDFESGIKHDNALRFIEKSKQKIHIIKSNHELIRTNYNLREGFSTDLACMAHLILLADYFDLGYIANGMVLESAYLRNGYEYRDFNNSSYWEKWGKMFKECGLELILPTSGLSEIITSKIVSNSIYKDLAYSCLRKFGGCNNCYKCFRKKLLEGIKLDMNKETEIALKKRPPKMASSMIYAMNKYGVEIKELNEFKNMDFSFLEKYYDYSFDLIDEKIGNFIKNKLVEYGIEKMNKQDIKKLKKIDLSEYA